ncbi:hypothetical protein [Streptomyces sp. NBC_00249]|uniref:hypothetical protein n=1 Tax=Streptomyces sp. NBC_00249 TaxID=2975690 RepID=UPI002257B6BB|nr:hypothetical protein [Streptomyces sp. NBC_00249]
MILVASLRMVLTLAGTSFAVPPALTGVRVVRPVDLPGDWTASATRDGGWRIAAADPPESAES